jgi:two-component system, cell cycle response regulator CtrA
MIAPELDLRSSETVRWLPHRKASVVNGDRRGAINTGKLVVNLDARGVSVDERQVRLTNKEYSILELLCLRKATTLTKEMFLNHLYGGVDEPELKIIDVFVCKLRKKLAQAIGGKHHIETVWGRGYVLRDPAPEPAALPRADDV